MQIPKRGIHLDFHTGPGVPSVGAKFDAEAFAETMKNANIDGVTVFAMCHHGQLYFETEHPARHPNLPKGVRLLEGQIEALRERGIRAPIYISVQCNEYAANLHPEWIALTPELQQVKWRNSAHIAGWQILDMSSPYQEYLTEIIAEVLRKFKPVDGLFLDMCWDQPSCSKWADAGMRKRGYDPKCETDRKKYAREVSYAYMERYVKMLEDSQTEPAGIWFNSREKTLLNHEKKFLRHVEIESLPTGGWGYAYFPYVARYVRPLGLPTLSHTARFFKSWGDNCSLKPEMALKYELCQMLAQNINCAVGDVLPPKGELCAPAYKLIGNAYGYIKKCEPHVEGMKPLAQIALVTSPELGDSPGESLLGASNALRQLRHQFDIVTPEHDLSPYELVIIPEAVEADEALKIKLRGYLKSGGALIVSGKAAFGGGEAALEELGAQCFGESPYSHTFIHAKGEAAEGLEDYGYVMYERGFRAKAKESAKALAFIGEPYFERDYSNFCGHEYTPEAQVTDYAAAIQNGRVVTFAAPLFEAYGKNASPNYRTLIGNCIKLLIDPLVTDDGPSFVESTLVANENAAALHILSFCPERRANGLDIVEDAIPVVDMMVSVRRDNKPKRVYLAPRETDLAFEYESGRVKTKLSFAGGHAMLMME